MSFLLTPGATPPKGVGFVLGGMGGVVVRNIGQKFQMGPYKKFSGNFLLRSSGLRGVHGRKCRFVLRCQLGKLTVRELFCRSAAARSRAVRAKRAGKRAEASRPGRAHRSAPAKIVAGKTRPNGRLVRSAGSACERLRILPQRRLSDVRSVWIGADGLFHIVKMTALKEVLHRTTSFFLLDIFIVLFPNEKRRSYR